MHAHPGPFAILSATLALAFGLDSLARAQAPEPPRHKAAFAATTPASYPKTESLATVQAWLQQEFTRVALEEHAKRMEGVKLQPGSCAGPIALMPRPDVLPRDEWVLLAARCAMQLQDPDATLVDESLRIGHVLQQVFMVYADDGVISPELRSAVAKAATHADPQVRSRALQLQSVLPEPRADKSEEIQSALRALADGNAQVRSDAVRALFFLGSSTEPEVNMLGAIAPDAIQLLLPIARGEDRRTMIMAILVLANTGEHVAPLLPEFLQWLDSPDRARRGSVYTAVRALGSRAEPLVPRLLEIAIDPTHPDRLRAISALGHTRAAGMPAIAALQSLAISEDMQASGSARAALKNLGPIAARAAPALRDHARTHADLRRECDWIADILEGKRKSTDPFEP